ncbi:MAG: ABC transporter permease [Bauldia sp.]|uniref:ABC transporter permease n=1 Tax=Bauldia sp. TaxID=2575872 RepID=UPI001DC912F1|nr:ABC transporter permease [Bauldia sp.]MCB1494350.1 ABC transporter permease [Bauldia sp.]
MFALLTNGRTVSAIGINNILQQTATVGIVAIAQTFVMLTGAIDISFYGAGLFISVLGAATMTSRYDLNIVGGEPVPISVGIGLMILAGISVGFVNGFVSSYFAVPALVVTLGTWQITQGLAQFLGQGYTITDLPEALKPFGRGEILGLPIPVWLMLGLFVAAYVVLQHTRFGRAIYAVGGNPGSAHLSGINVRRIQVGVFVVAGLLLAIAAISVEARLMAVSNRTFLGITIDSIAAVTVGGVSIYGGRGTIAGVFLGTFILAVIGNGLNSIGATPDIQGVTKGAIILAAIAIDSHQSRRRNLV